MSSSGGSFGHSPLYTKSLENTIFSHTPSPTASHSTLLSSSSSSMKALLVLLRSFPLASGVTSSLPQFDRFSEARISPDRELIAFRTIENDVLLFSISHSILLPAFQITNIDHYAWIGPIPFSSSSPPSTKLSNGFVALVTLDHNGSISIYPFDRNLLKDWLSTASPSSFSSPTSPIQTRRFTVDYTNQPRSLILDSEDSFPHSNPNLKSGGYITHTLGIDYLLEALTIKPSPSAPQPSILLMRNIGFDRILVMLTSSSSETDQQKHSYTIAILSISPSQITPIRRFSVHSPLEIVDLTCTQSWIFALKETGSVEVWTLDGFRKGLVDVNSYCAIQAPGSWAPKDLEYSPFKYVAVSNDLLTLVVCHRCEMLLVVDLDDYYQLFRGKRESDIKEFVEVTNVLDFASNQQTQRSHSEDAKSNGIDFQRRSKVLSTVHWFEQPGAFSSDKGVTRSFEYRPPGKHLTPLSTPVNKALNGFSVQSDNLPTSHHQDSAHSSFRSFHSLTGSNQNSFRNLSSVRASVSAHLLDTSLIVAKLKEENNTLGSANTSNISITSNDPLAHSPGANQFASPGGSQGTTPHSAAGPPPKPSGLGALYSGVVQLPIDRELVDIAVTHTTILVYLRDSRKNRSLFVFNRRAVPKKHSGEEEDRRLGAALGLEYEASYDGYSLQPSGGLGSEVRGDMLSTTSHLLMLKGEGDSYYITSGGLWCTLSNGPQTQQELLNHLIMFDTASSADKLCEMNGWDSRSLRLNALSLGLKFRQPNVIEPALNGLDQDQQLTGSRTLLDYIHNNTLTSQDEEFFDQLLQIAMDFVSKMITTKATELLKKKSTHGDRSKRFARFEWVSPASLGHSIAELPSIDSLMGEDDSVFSNVMLSTSSLSVSSDYELPTIEEHLIGFANILESLRSIYVKSKTSRQQGSQSIGVIVKSRGTPSKAVKVEQRKSLKPRVLFSQNSQSEANSTVLAALANLTNGGSLGSLGSIDLSDMELDQMAEKNDEQKRPPTLGLLQRQGSQISTVETVNDNEELQTAFSSIHLRWERMERIEVIRDALLNGLLSLAQSFLQFKKRKSVSLPSGSPQPSVQSAEDHLISWEQLKRTCFCLIYQAVIHNQIDVATKMLCNLGQDLYSNFKEIAFQTTRRSVRSALLSLLEQTNKVSLDERALLDFVRLLESKYPNSDYYLEYTRRSAIENNGIGAMTGSGSGLPSVESGFSPKGPSGSTAIEFSGSGGDQDLIKISCDDLDDLTSEAERKYDFQLLGRQRSGGLYGSAVSSMSSGRARSLSGNMRAANAAISKNKIAICPSAKSDSYSTNYHSSEDSTSMAKGYLHISLVWAKAWNDETRGRILLETMKDASSVDLYSQLRYYIAHNDWRHIVSWVKQFCIHLQHSSIEAKARQELLDRVTIAAADATTFVSELLFNELAKQRIFLTPATEVNPFEAMMKRLTRTGQLFTHSLGESFHTPFVAFCIEKNLPGVLQAYLDFFQLARTPQDAQAIGLGQTAKREWAQFFGFLRAHTDIFGAAIVNAKLLLRSGSSSSIFGSVRGSLNIETILLSGRVLLAIGTALLAPVSISEVLRQDNESQLEQLADKPWYFTKRTLKDSIKSFPYLEKALFGNSSTISSMTSFINPAQFLPEVDRLLRKSSPFSTSTLPYLRRGHLLSPSMAAINQTEEVLPSFADPSRFAVDVYTDDIDVSYYLSKGRPLQAFDLFVKERREARKGTGGGLPATTSGPLEGMISPPLTAREGEELQSYIRDLSFQYLLDSSALSACVTFLELCGLDSQALRVDIQAALRIHHSKQLWKQPSAGSITSLSTTPTVSSLQAVVTLFQDFKTNPSSLRSALQLLETATKTVPSLHATSSASSLLATAGYLPSGILSDIPTMSIVNKQQFEKKENDPWLLISLFCHTHNLTLSTHHLTELAKQNDWVNFLYEAQTHKFPVHQVLETIPNFKDKQLREHLYIVVRNNSQDDDSTTSSLTTDLDASGKEDIFQAVLSVMDPKAQKTITAGQALLVKSLEQNRPFFAVIAPCFKGISRLDCITCWFISAYPSLLDFLLLPSVPVAPRTTNVEWTLQDLHTAIVTLCEENELLSLRRGFMIFDLKNPILLFLDFYRAFIQNRFSECQNPLHSFVGIVAGKSPSVFQVGTVDWVSSLAMELIDRRLSKSLSPYEQSHLLRLLAESNFNDQYRRQWRTFKVLQKTNISLDLSADPLNLVDLLLEKGLYSDARSYSLANDIPPHHITVAEALALVKEYQKGSLWAQEHERRVLWNRCQSLFIQHSCSSELAGTFFLEQAKLHTQSTKEYAFLLSTALDWFNGTHSLDGEACKSPEFLQELENRMLLLSVSAEVGELSSPPKMLGSSPSMISPQVPRRERSSSSASVNTWTKNVEEGNEQVLHVTVNRLLSVGNLSKAEAICNQFKYDSLDVQLAKSAVLFAEGSIAIQTLPYAVSNILNEKYPHVNLTSVGKADILDMITGCAVSAKDFCFSVAVKWKVAQILSLSYQAVCSKNPYDILQFLLKNGKETLSLAHSFISQNNMSSPKVAGIIADIFYKALLEHQEKARIGIPSGRGNIIDPFCSTVDFAELVNLSMCPLEVGNRLLIHLYDNLKKLAHEIQVELLVRAHYCYLMSCCLDGCELVLRVVRDRMNDYVEKGEFKLLVRLLCGIKKYGQMEYIIHTLVANGQFELLLRKDAAQDNEARVELRIALHRYLLEHLPHDTEKLQLLFLSFNMWRELAENLKKKADEKLRGFAASSSMKSNSSRDLGESIFRELPNVLEMYLDAADYFVKERCYHVSNRCIALANLVTLQIQEPDQRVLSLTPQEAKNFMGSLNCSYSDAVILAEAYEVDSSEWAGPLFSQIIQSNFGFVEEFMKTNPPSLVFQELAKKFKNDPQRSKHNQNFRLAFQYLDDRFLRMEICKDLGFPVTLREDEEELVAILSSSVSD